jgi:pantetheine-phosphate adenylyltransferase
MKTIAIYPGSFNPAHVGHLNILEKAERIFGRGNVVIAIGINPDKNSVKKIVFSETGCTNTQDDYLFEQDNKAKLISKKINRTVITYSRFLHELIEDYEKEDYNVVIIRGLRNGVDLDYEVNQMRFINDFKKDINVVYITCDQEFEHISSSAIRKIEQFGGPDMIKKYIL